MAAGMGRASAQRAPQSSARYGCWRPRTPLPRVSGADPVEPPLADPETKPESGGWLLFPLASFGLKSNSAWPFLSSSTLGNRLTYLGLFCKVELVALASLNCRDSPLECVKGLCKS